jgi:hypothetical protein
MPLHFKNAKNEINTRGCGNFLDLRMQPAKKSTFGEERKLSTLFPFN